MDTKQLDEYRQNAKVGDRLRCKHYSDIWYVREVVHRGVVISLGERHAIHEHLCDWEHLHGYTVAHKEV